MLEEHIGTPEQQKLVAKLLSYDYEIYYKPGSENSVADTLSKAVGDPKLDALFVSWFKVGEDIKKATVGHTYLERISKLAKENPRVLYSWCNELVFYKKCVVVPPNSQIIPQLLWEFHDSYIGGHSGVLQTYKRLA